MHEAAFAKQAKIAQLLLDYGIDPNLQDFCEKTAADRCANQETLQIIKAHQIKTQTKQNTNDNKNNNENDNDNNNKDNESKEDE